MLDFKGEFIKNDDIVIVGVSGGADSICLLHILHSYYKIKTIAVHINHNLRAEESKRDEMFVRNFCENIGVRYIIKNVYIEKNKQTIEEAARAIRYKIFEELRIEHNAAYIATAHNKNDNVETMLLNFFRGTGLKGLRGIPEKRNAIIRPLLNCSRKEIESYILENNLQYVNDSTNFTDIYTRNKIRKIVHEYNLLKPLTTAREILTEEDNFLEQETKKHFDDCVSNNELNIKKFKKLHIAIKRRIAKKLLESWSEQGFSAIHINVFVDLAEKPRGKKLDLPNNLQILRKCDKIVMVEKLIEKKFKEV
ncbi:MAG: tRNA lysidine(34) synthetase TilS [Defluviitaleaceae bacterium]|nr:tRNA lysidine(34) synthetase TilS [Defluviitaleaceae bacterium]